MKSTVILTMAAAVGVLAASAGAQSFNTPTPGPAGLIPATGTGGGTYSNVANSVSASPFASTVAIPVTVNTVDRITLNNWTHTWLGDMQIVLFSPDGIGHNLMVRLGHSPASTFGNSGDPTGTPHSLQLVGLPVPDTSVATDMPAGAYGEHYGNPAKLWAAGNTIDGMVVNNGLAGIGVQGPGVWTLRIYDWAAGDTGAITDWDLEVNGFPPPAPTVYCTAKTNSLGCTPAIGASGISSASSGSGFAVTGANLRNNKPTMLVYSDAGRAASPFFGGLLCVNGPISRGLVVSSGGTPVGTLDCSGAYSLDMNEFATGSLGGVPRLFLQSPGTVVNAQIWARDDGFLAPNNASLTNGVEWTVGP